MLSGKVLLVPGAEVAHRRHVDLVEGGQHGGLVLGLDEALGETLAQGRKLAADLAGGTGWLGRHRRLCAGGRIHGNTRRADRFGLG